MTQSLTGRTVVVTRPRAQSLRLAEALRSRGAEVVFAPLIRTAPPRSFRALDEALRGLAGYDAVAFASVNAVDAFFARAGAVSKGKPRRPRLVAAVGPATRKALERHGWPPSLVPDDARARGLAASLRLPAGARILLPRAERGREELCDRLRAAGMKVSRASAYRTLQDPAGRRVLRRTLAAGAHAVLFASPSAVRSAAGALGRARMKRVFRRTAAVAIGPTTSEALRTFGVRPAAVSHRPDPESFARAALEAVS